MGRSGKDTPAGSGVSPHLLAQVPAGSSVLEIGIGTGKLLAELAGRGEKVIGVDHSPAMLEEARRRITASGNARSSSAWAR